LLITRFDNIIFPINIIMSLPKNLLYANKVDSMGARPYTSNIQPQGAQTYSANDVMIFNIPCNRNTVLSPHDAYLKFTMTGTNGATAQPWVRLSKAGAHGFIQRIRVFHGSTLLEDLDNYGNLLAQLVTHQRASDNVCNKGSVVEGFDESPAVNVASVYNINAIRGMRISNAAYGTAADVANGLLAIGGTTPAKTFCLPLVSILGTLTDKYLPLFAMTSAPIRLEVQLVSSAIIPFVSLTAMASFAITNVEVIGSFIELSDQALAIVQQASGGAALTMAVDRYSSLVSNATLNNAVTNVSAPVPFKYSSVQAILNTIRQHASGAITFDAFGSFNYNINEYYYSFGSETLPTKHPGSSSSGGGDHQTMFNYYCSALGSPAALDYSPFISLYSYDTLAIPVASTETANTAANNLTTISGSFGIGQELVSYPSANQDQMFSGRNTSTEDIYHNLIFNANATTPAVRLDYYCLHHAVIICENGQAQIRY
jgi:hypothetical protein